MTQHTYSTGHADLEVRTRTRVEFDIYRSDYVGGIAIPNATARRLAHNILAEVPAQARREGECYRIIGGACEGETLRIVSGVADSDGDVYGFLVEKGHHTYIHERFLSDEPVEAPKAMRDRVGELVRLTDPHAAHASSAVRGALGRIVETPDSSYMKVEWLDDRAVGQANPGLYPEDKGFELIEGTELTAEDAAALLRKMTA